MRVALVLLVSGVAVVAGNWYAKSRSRPAPDTRGLIAEPALVRLDPAGNPTGEVTVRLTNESGHPVEITDTETTCGCARLSPAAGTVLGPNEGMDLRVRVSYPEEGYRQAAIRIKHSRGRVPVEVVLVMTGNRPVPYLSADSTNRFTHIGLDKLPPDKTFRVVAYERPGSPPWLSAARSQVGEVEVSGPRLTERDVGALVERTYAYDLRWVQLPRTREFRGDILANILTDGGKPGDGPTVKVAEVRGTLAIPPEE